MNKDAIPATHYRYATRQSARDFDNPIREWRRLFAETWGTFLLVLVAAGAHMVGEQSGEVTTAAKVIAPGLVVMVVDLFYGQRQWRASKSCGPRLRLQCGAIFHGGACPAISWPKR